MSEKQAGTTVIKPAIEPGLAARAEFPIFSLHHDKPLAYLDTAASSQKPAAVIDRLTVYLGTENANIHRGAYALSARATEHYEEVRRKAAAFLGAESERCIVFTRGSTEGINLVSRAFEGYFEPGDAVLLTLLEHHSNIVPWQLLAQRRGLKVVFADIHDNGLLNMQDFRRKLLASKAKLVAVTQLANSLGVVTPLSEIIELSHQHGAKVLVDAAQSAAHMSVSVQALNCDFLVFSGHKIYGPTGCGVLYAKEELLSRMEPFQGGGEMIERVTVDGSSWAPYPRKFEAGTPAIAEVIALGTALDFVSAVGLSRIAEHERSLTEHAWERLKGENDVELYGPGPQNGLQSAIVSFNLKGVHGHDLATIADEKFNVQFRSGHHCAQPALKRLGLNSSARISFGIYSDIQDLDALLAALRHARKIFAG